MIKQKIISVKNIVCLGYSSRLQDGGKRIQKQRQNKAQICLQQPSPLEREDIEKNTDGGPKRLQECFNKIYYC